MKMTGFAATAMALIMLLAASGCATGPSREQLEQERIAQAQQAKRLADEESSRKAREETENEQAALNSAKRIRSLQAVLAAIGNDYKRIESTDRTFRNEFKTKNGAGWALRWPSSVLE